MSDRDIEWHGGKLRVYLRDEQGDELLGEYEYVPIGSGLALPNVPVWDPELGVLLEIEVRGGRPECVAIRSAPDGPPLTLALLKRIAVDRLIDGHVRMNAVRLVATKGGEVVGEMLFDEGGRVQEDVKRESRRRLADDDLAAVAEAYRDAVAAGLPTGRAITERWRVEPATARRWISEARKRGLLAPAPAPRVAGEQTPTPKRRRKRG